MTETTGQCCNVWPCRIICLIFVTFCQIKLLKKKTNKVTAEHLKTNVICRRANHPRRVMKEIRRIKIGSFSLMGNLIDPNIWVHLHPEPTHKQLYQTKRFRCFNVSINGYQSGPIDHTIFIIRARGSTFCSGVRMYDNWVFQCCSVFKCYQFFYEKSITQLN